MMEVDDGTDVMETVVGVELEAELGVHAPSRMRVASVLVQLIPPALTAAMQPAKPGADVPIA
jgi:hypothetical protein